MDWRLNDAIYYQICVFQPHSVPVKSPALYAHAHACKSDDEDLPGLANEAVVFCNSTHKCQFELVEPLYLQFVRTTWDRWCSNYHMSFIARSKDSSRKLKLFFAELSAGYLMTCTTVEPGNPLFPLGGCETCHPQGVIYHPFARFKFGGRRYRSTDVVSSMTATEQSAKKLLCERYIFKDSFEDFYPEDDKELRQIVIFYSLEALRWYSLTTNGRLFELLEVVSSVRFSATLCCNDLDAMTWVHVNFKARNNDPLCIDASPELFFAELNLDRGWVSHCVSMTQPGSGSSKSEAETSCVVCREYCPMFHPEDGYVAGRCGGKFADALVKDRSWGAKVDLLEKVDTYSYAAGVQVGKLAMCSINEK